MPSAARLFLPFRRCLYLYQICAPSDQQLIILNGPNWPLLLTRPRASDLIFGLWVEDRVQQNSSVYLIAHRRALYYAKISLTRLMKRCAGAQGKTALLARENNVPGARTRCQGRSSGRHRHVAIFDTAKLKSHSKRLSVRSKAGGAISKVIFFAYQKSTRLPLLMAFYWIVLHCVKIVSWSCLIEII